MQTLKRLTAVKMSQPPSKCLCPLKNPPLQPSHQRDSMVTGSQRQSPMNVTGILNKSPRGLTCLFQVETQLEKGSHLPGPWITASKTVAYAILPMVLSYNSPRQSLHYLRGKVIKN